MNPFADRRQRRQQDSSRMERSGLPAERIRRTGENKPRRREVSADDIADAVNLQRVFNLQKEWGVVSKLP
ncbi:hypothetical protein LINPERHAP2_LOCUS26603 [Linum perenne]